MSTLPDYEALGSFYLGREYDAERAADRPDLLLYDSPDLTTHAVCVGMTGSGKTGLCLAILEEAAMDGIPALVIDPKGDIPNLMLTFPDLAPTDFRPWVNEDDARRANVTPDDFAAQQAELWKNGLAKWGQDGARIKALRAATQIDIYTPGSSAGIPVSLLASFDAPSAEVIDDAEVFSELIESTVSGLLALVGIAGDPVRSREHILLSNILSTAWRAGHNLNMPELIRQIQKPPFQTIGVMDLEGFYSTKERFDLSLIFNNLLASPGFATWMQGQPLDIQSLLYTPEGKPRIAILSIAHLSDTERMFFVSLLLNRTVSWMRSQAGTTSLRALVYMDEIYGYLPPSENPPSKKPMMTLLKQARAYGVGVLLASQNPVDLDYKALSNIGTWFLGRLQTERDKLRVLEGLKGAAAANNADFDAAEMDKALSGLAKRVFLLNNVHEGAPALFETRWVMSYLRGPMTKSQISQIMKPRKAALPATSASAPAAETSDGLMISAPLLPATVEQLFVPLEGASTEGLAYAPAIFVDATVVFDERAKGITETRTIRQVIPLDRSNGQLLTEEVEEPEEDEVRAWKRAAAKGLSFQPLAKSWLTKTAFSQVSKEVRDRLYRGEVLEVFFAPGVNQVAKPGEGEAEFRIRLGQELREKRDQAVEAIRQKFAAKMAMEEKQVLTAKTAVERQKAQANAAGLKTIANVGTSILGALLGGKRKSGISAITGAGKGAFTSASSAWQQQQDVKGAEEKLEAEVKELEQAKADLQAAQDKIKEQFDPVNILVEKITIRPKQKDVSVKTVALLWRPEDV